MASGPYGGKIVIMSLEFSNSAIFVSYFDLCQSLNFDDDFWVLQNPDFNGVELSLKLHNDGTLGSFEAPSGNYT